MLLFQCRIGSALLKHKLDRRQFIALAKKHLNFICNEEEANSVYLKLEPAREMFLRHTENQKKSDMSKDRMPAAKLPSHDDFEPKHTEEWNVGDWSSGCQRKTSLDFGAEDGFLKISGVKLPDTRRSWYSMSMMLGECEMACRKNFSCTAYANFSGK
ncbi:hypothetical protein L6452_05980 [Arctium lappa]|uniref:Uncharacterized protein n=1 Tax=Arctium lappa TaxID=4217 RepID=A0ACB9EHL0_ARCLA|nr:hypothetical protein L6452_05980 [Arctium lappa]